MKRSILSALLVLVIINTSWASPEEEERLKLQNNLDRSAFFDVELLQELSKIPGVGYENVLISPISIKATLGMLWEGAGPYAAEEIRQALRLPETRQEVQTYFSSVLRSLQKKSSGLGYTLDIASRLYITETIILNEYRRNTTMPNRAPTNTRPTSSGDRRKPASPSSPTSSTAASQSNRPNTVSATPPTPTIPVIEPNFTTALTRYYGAEATFLDFSKTNEAANAINGWASGLTHSLITQIISPGAISPDTQLFLGNVVYFKGTWEHAFDPQLSKPGNFYLQSGTLFRAKMMEQLNYFKYAEIDGLAATALELPYSGNKFSMLLLLPNEKNGINQMLRDLPHNPLNSIVSQLVLQEIQVSIPRFESEFSIDLVAPLRSLGIEHVFLSLEGSLPGISRRFPLKVDAIQHKVKIIVNEQGSEAAGATGVLVVPLMGAATPKFEADHPFLFFIRDTETGAFLFAGKMTHPQNSGPLLPAASVTSSTRRPTVKPVSHQDQQLYASVFQTGQQNPSQSASESTANNSPQPKQGEEYLPSGQSSQAPSQRRGRMAFYPRIGGDEDMLVFEQ